MKFKKNPLVVTVRFATAETHVQTLEGLVTCCTGDAVLTGVAGEHWPVARMAFEESYQALPPIQMGAAGRYLKRPIVVEARRVLDAEEVTLPNANVLSAKSGDWIVTGPNGDEWVVEAAIFANTYEAIQP